MPFLYGTHRKLQCFGHSFLSLEQEVSAAPQVELKATVHFLLDGELAHCLP